MKSNIPIPSMTLLAVVAVASFAGCHRTAQPETRQQHVHEMGHHVMPFDMDKTTHVFEMNETGGIMRVVAKDPADSDQIAMIQMHLQHEGALFQKGDFSDPAKLHGESMSGLHELSEGASNLSVEYTPLPEGAQLAFTSADIKVITAIHRWFGAQLSEHGADATSN